MTRLSKSAWLTGGLLVLATVAWLATTPQVESSKPAPDAQPRANLVGRGESGEISGAASAGTPERWRSRANQVDFRPQRTALRPDPFSYEKTRPAAELAAATPTNAPPQLTLRGVSIHDGRSFAVVNRRVVAEGDSIGDWRVVRIEAESVSVEGPAGVYVLTLRGTPVFRPAGSLALKDSPTHPGGPPPVLLEAPQ